jgi:hypothetical protein
MIDTYIQARLAALGERLQKAEARLRTKGRMTADHQATNKELQERYWKLDAQVSRDDATAESLGHHVSDLDLPGFGGERLAHFAGPALECDGAQEAER